MKLGIIGCGEVGRCYADALAKAGNQILVLCDERPSPALRILADQLQAEIVAHPHEWVTEVDVIINAVFGDAALSIARKVLPIMKKGAIFADFTTADPAHMKEAASLALTAGVGFVDVAIMGAVTASKSKTPLICAGQGASAIRNLMYAAGAPIKVVSESAGDAAMLKLLRSIFTKGLEALSIECLVVADQKGLRSALYEVLSDIDHMPLQEFMEMSVCTHIVHAKRRLKEVQTAKQLMHDANLKPQVLNGVESLFQQTANSLASAPEIGGTVEEGLAWLTKQATLKP